MKLGTVTFFVFLFFVDLKGGQCDVKCYTCSTKDSSTCLHPEKNRLELKKCNTEALKEMKQLAANVEPNFQAYFEVQPPSGIPFNCMKQVTKVGNEEYVIRGCQLANADEKLSICKILSSKRYSNANVTFCSLCSRDGCNSARSFQYFSLSNLTITFVIFLYGYI